MELQHLRYVVEVARWGSISRAAKHLYMGQPNLSKAVKEVELEIGRPLFRRTAQGVEPTRSGEDFLFYARGVLDQMEQLRGLYTARDGSRATLSLWMPRASYLAAAYGQWLGTLGNRALDLQYRETTANAAIDAVLSGEAHLGIVRFEARHAGFFESVMQANGLHHAPLWEFQMQVLMHRSHPLAHLDTVPLHRLDEYPEVTHGDSAFVLPQAEAERPPEPHSAGRIAVFDRAGEFNVLRGARGSYMWVSPMPAGVLQREEMCQRPCPEGRLLRDAAVWKGALPPLASGFLDAVHEQISALVTAGK